jgi:hypothetical protein
MLNGTFVLPQMLADGGLLGGGPFTGGFPLKLHRKFLFGCFRGRNIKVTVYRGAL